MKKTTEYVNQLDNQEIYCKSCGATYDIHLAKCPYCGEVNEYGDEIEYQNHLDRIHSDMEDMIDDSLEGATDELKEKGKGAAKVFIIIAAAIVVIAAIAICIIKFSDKKKAEAAIDDILWQKETYATLDQLYEAEDYDGLLAFMEDYYADPDYDKHTLYNYEHIEFMTAYMHYKYMLEDIERINKHPDDIDFYKQSVLLYALELKYENWDAKYNTVKSVSKKEYDLIMCYIEEADDILLNHLGLDSAGVEVVHKKVLASPDSNLMQTDKVYDAADGLEWIY